MDTSLFAQIVAACLIGGLLSIGAAALVIYGLPRRALGLAVSFSTGLLLASATLDLLPEVLEGGAAPNEVFALLLAGFLGFFALEKFAIWRHAHGAALAGCGRSDDRRGTGDAHPHHDHVQDQHAEALLILIGDSFHNFSDGLLIAAAFMADPAIGWSAALAVIAHEIPQEAGDFAILLAAGWGRRRALFWNGVSSLTGVLGGVLGYFLLDAAREWVPIVITLAASSFLYVALVDLVPRLKRESSGAGWHGILLAAGIGVVAQHMH